MDNDRQVLIRRLRRLVELIRPKVSLPREERLVCDKLLLKPEISRAYWNQVDVGLTLGEYKLVHLLGVERRLLCDLPRGLRPPALRRLYRR
jgi:hypothetical protein